jgi:alpha-1,6-mannosyl-glycoprotein beta-1,2-N-acetylglucosaminyltransferase
VCVCVCVFLLLISSGIHHKRTCASESDIARWTETDGFYRTNRKHLFPNRTLSVHLKYEVKRLLKQTNGGWSDLRDHQLCLSFALKTPRNSSNIS